MMNRRNFFKVVGVAGATAVGSKTALAAGDVPEEGGREFLGVLVDTTLCTGCMKCEQACAESNGLPAPVGGEDALAEHRETCPEHLTVVNRHETSAGPVTVKQQCMHCNQPACAAACLTRAMVKTKDGPIIWRANKCMGCRFCMVSCPFDVPKFQYDSAIPEIRKCSMCWDRLSKGEHPACVSACPAGALTFGPRRDLLEVAKARIAGHPDRYVHEVYGEDIVGGTGYLYLAAAPFKELGFKTDLGKKPYPELTTGFLYGVPMVFLLWPALLLGLHRATRKVEGTDAE